MFGLHYCDECILSAGIVTAYEQRPTPQKERHCPAKKEKDSVGNTDVCRLYYAPELRVPLAKIKSRRDRMCK